MIQPWYVLYNYIVLPVLYIILYLLGFFNEKIKRGIKGRKTLFFDLATNIKKIDKEKKTIWFHSSSMGEFEQAKPIIEKLRKEKNVNIIVTFFSPSGYENSLKYPYADVISYLPFDTPRLAEKFVKIIKADAVVFMRYDIWPNIILQIQKYKIPSFIVDATMRSDSKRKLPFIRNFHKKLYSGFSKILTVSDADVNNFLSFGIDVGKVTAVGDTRFDRVYQKSIHAKEKKLLPDNFFEGKKVFVFGSSWESDEEVVFPALMKLLKYDPDTIVIVVPHEPTILHLEKIEHTFINKYSTIRFSYLNNYNNERVIIVDSIGILLTLYYYADVAYVGGSFKQGIHNVLEPAVYGIPVLFGPKFHNSQEAEILIKLGGAFVISNKRETYIKLRGLFSNNQSRINTGNICYGYVNNNIGATDKISEEICRFI